MSTTIELKFTWSQRAILLILYLSKGEISKQKLNALLYLIYKELKNMDPSEDLDFYINMKTKEIEITTPGGDTNINDILDILSLDELIDVEINNGKVYLTEEGYKIAKEIMNDLKYKDEVGVILKIVAQYRDMSDKGLTNVILENLKHL